MTCEKCGAVLEIGSYPFCKGGHARGTTRVNGDECDYVDHNLAEQPIRIRSWSERRRLMKERGLEDAPYIEPPPTFEGKAATSNWAAIGRVDPEHLAWLGEAMTRGGTKTETEPPMKIDTYIRRLDA